MCSATPTRLPPGRNVRTPPGYDLLRYAVETFFESRPLHITNPQNACKSFWNRLSQQQTPDRFGRSNKLISTCCTSASPSIIFAGKAHALFFEDPPLVELY